MLPQQLTDSPPPVDDEFEEVNQRLSHLKALILQLDGRIKSLEQAPAPSFVVTFAQVQAALAAADSAVGLHGQLLQQLGYPQADGDAVNFLALNNAITIFDRVNNGSNPAAVLLSWKAGILTFPGGTVATQLLPTGAVPVGWYIWFDTVGALAVVPVTPPGTNTINNASSYNLPQNKMCLVWKSTSTNWRVIHFTASETSA